MRGTILFRVEAGPAIGAGHLMRCLALAETYATRGGRALFVLSGGAEALQPRVRDAGFDVAHLDELPGSAGDAARTLALAERAGATFLVADGYQLVPSYHRKLRSAAIPLLAIDDGLDKREHCAELVLNQNVHAREADYERRAPHTRLLLGLEFVLLRKEFLRFSGWRRKTTTDQRRVLVTLGGSDPHNFSEPLLRALSYDKTLETTLVAGAANSRVEELENLALAAGSHVRVRVDVRAMAALMSRSDVAISSGGSTVWELAFMGLPAIVGATTPVEDLVVAGLQRQKLFEPIGRFSDVRADEVVKAAVALLDDPARRSETSTFARTLVDGRGCERVLAAMGELSAASRSIVPSSSKGATG